MEKSLQQQPANCLKIVLFGPESTGKTSLAKALAKHFNTEWVPEFARDYLQKKHEDVGEICAPEDLLPIAQGQIQSENHLAKKANKVLFCDTNVLQTWVYAQAYYDNYENPKLEEAAEKNHYDLYFLTDIDVPWEADDLRDRPHEREEMFLLFKKELENRELPFFLLSGNKKERMKTAQQIVNKLLENQI